MISSWLDYHIHLSVYVILITLSILVWIFVILSFIEELFSKLLERIQGGDEMTPEVYQSLVSSVFDFIRTLHEVYSIAFISGVEGY